MDEAEKIGEICGTIVGAILVAVFAAPFMAKRISKNEATQKRDTAIIAILILLAVPGIAFLGSHPFGPSVNDRIIETCANINKSCPKKLDELTRLDNCEPGDLRITYNYTLNTLAVPTPDQLKQAQEVVARAAKSHSETKFLLDKGITLTYRYKNQQGKVIVVFDVSSQSQP